MSQPKSAAETVPGSRGRVEEPTVRYKRVVISRLGGPEVLEVREEELPEPGLAEVRVRILATGASLPDLMMREGVHPEAPRPPFTPGWDLVGVIDKLGAGAYALEPEQMVAALPVWGANVEYICLPQEELVPVPAGLDPAEALCLVFNYATAYQMMRRTARVKPGQRVLIHAAAGGIGTALLQLGRLIDLEMYGTASAGKHELVSSLGAIPIDYHKVDFAEEIHRLTADGVDIVFDGICSPDYLRRSFKSLRPGGKVIAYGGTSTLRGGQLASGRRHRRLRRLQYLATIGGPMAASHLAPGNKRITSYSIQWLKRLRPTWYREDLSALLELLRQGKIEPIIAERIPLDEVARAHELIGSGSVMGKIVLLCGTGYRQ